MGASISSCSLGYCFRAENEPEYETRKIKSNPRERAQSLSITADSSVASIVSHSDRLIPEAYAPVDIQLLSRGRRKKSASGTSISSRAVVGNSIEGISKVESSSAITHVVSG